MKIIKESIPLSNGKYFGMKQAIQIAKLDYMIGIESAMLKLNEYFNCSLYFEVMQYVEDVDEDNFNLHMRDIIYKKHGIYDMMQYAYKMFWGLE